ncbi:hypothetical protein, partial [Pantoea agglomerans]|uniref:hypothetical protein n=1 Tax=Enterobacter agglomerans TaxID=549 RepID=UPI003C7A8DA5
MIMLRLLEIVRRSSVSEKIKNNPNLFRLPAGIADLFTINTDGLSPVVTCSGYFSEPGLMKKKKNRTPTPHDATFRQFLTHPDVARDF